MNTKETAEITGIPAELLIRMRTRETRTRKSGPPYCKKVGKDGMPRYVYSKPEVRTWLKSRNCLITPADAALILGLHRDDILAIHGIRSFTVRKKTHSGTVVVDNSTRVYVWIPCQSRKRQQSPRKPKSPK